MNPIVNICSDLKSPYSQYNFASRVKDRFKIKVNGKKYIEDIKTQIIQLNFPPNINSNAYSSNMERAIHSIGKEDMRIAPNVFRKFDYNYLNKFQKELFAYSVVNTIKIVLRINKKTIKNSCILVYDAGDSILKEVIEFLAMDSRYIILLSNDIKKTERISEYIIANYGVTPVITRDYFSAFNIADFVITSKELPYDPFDKPTWYLNNLYMSKKSKGINIDNVSYKTPWNVDNMFMSPEVLGALLCQMDEKNVINSLKYNNIIIDKITFMGKDIEIQDI